MLSAEEKGEEICSPLSRDKAAVKESFCDFWKEKKKVSLQLWKEASSQIMESNRPYFIFIFNIKKKIYI